MPITRQDTLLTDDLIAKYTCAGYWDTTTFSDVLRRNASAMPDREAFVDARTRITWCELWEISGRIANGLRARGIAAGDVVAVQLPNRVEFVCLFAAITRLGAVLCQYPPDYRAREVEFILGFSDARAVVVPQRWKSFDFTPMIDEMRSQLPGLQLTVVVEDDRHPQVTSPGWTRLADLAADSDSPGTPDFPRRDANDVMRIAFTSGTTGDPKAVMHTSNTTIFTNRRQNEAWGITTASRILVLLPVGLNVGLFAIVQTSLAAATAVLMEQFDAGAALSLVQSEQITTFFAAPTALIALLNHPALAECDLSSLELVQTGGASTPVQVLREANDRLGCPVVDVYGMLESGWESSTSQAEPFEEWAGTVGRPYPWLQVRILDSEGNDVPAGEEGEIAKTGPTMTVGYFRNPDKNQESWTDDGWFRSGDLGSFDDSGRLSISGRSKDMIIHGGANIWPRELEEILHTHPKIIDVAIIGVPDDYFGENVCACVITQPGVAVELDEVISYLAGQVAKYKLPQRLELFDEFPLGPTGKVVKQSLRQEVSKRSSPATSGSAAPGRP